MNLRIEIEDGQIWLEDADTGQDLLTNLKAQQALRATTARLQAEQEARQAEREARLAAEAEVARLKALLDQKTG